MTGASAWMMTAHWDGQHLLLLWAMWTVMMMGMMLPSASPLVLLVQAASRGDPQQGSAARQIYALAAGYLIVWTVFSLGATALQRGLAALLLVSPMMEVTSSRVGATLLLLAGVYQLTPMKHACLRGMPVPAGIPDDPMADWMARRVPLWASSTAPISWAAAGR